METSWVYELIAILLGNFSVIDVKYYPSETSIRLSGCFPFT